MADKGKSAALAILLGKLKPEKAADKPKSHDFLAKLSYGGEEEDQKVGASGARRCMEDLCDAMHRRDYDEMVMAMQDFLEVLGVYEPSEDDDPALHDHGGEPNLSDVDE